MRPAMCHRYTLTGTSVKTLSLIRLLNCTKTGKLRLSESIITKGFDPWVKAFFVVPKRGLQPWKNKPFTYLLTGCFFVFSPASEIH
jgi:hypothetical protein